MFMSSIPSTRSCAVFPLHVHVQYSLYTFMSSIPSTCSCPVFPLHVHVQYSLNLFMCSIPSTTSPPTIRLTLHHHPPSVTESQSMRTRPERSWYWLYQPSLEFVFDYLSTKHNRLKIRLVQICVDTHICLTLSEVRLQCSMCEHVCVFEAVWRVEMLQGRVREWKEKGDTR